MNFDNPVVASVSDVSGNVFIKRAGVEVPLRDDMVLQVGDVLRTTSDSIAIVSIPGTAQQIPALLELSGGGEATLGFDPDAGPNGQVVVTSNSADGVGSVVLLSEFEGENHAAVLDGSPGDASMSGLFGAGVLASGVSAAPLAGAVGAAALFGGLSDDDSAPGFNNPGGAGSTSPAQEAGGLSQTVSDLTNSVTEITEPVPVVGDVAGTAAQVLESTLVGDNNGGLNGILSGVATSLSDGLEGTPLDVVSEPLFDGVLGTVSGALGVAANQVTAFGEGTPLAPVTNLLGDVLGTSGPNVEGEVGGVFGTVLNLTQGANDLLEPVPGLDLLGGGLDALVSSLLVGDNEGGVQGLLSGLGDGLQSALLPTPLSIVGDGAQAGLDAVAGVFGTAGDALSSIGVGTPAEPVVGLLSGLLGSGGNSGQFQAFDGLPLLDGTLDLLTSSISSSGLPTGGLLSGLPSLPGLDNLTA